MKFAESQDIQQEKPKLNYAFLAACLNEFFSSRQHPPRVAAVEHSSLLSHDNTTRPPPTRISGGVFLPKCAGGTGSHLEDKGMGRMGQPAMGAYELPPGCYIGVDRVLRSSILEPLHDAPAGGENSC